MLKIDKFSDFIITRVLEDKDLSEKEENLFKALAVGNGLTPKRVYNEAIQLFTTYLMTDDNDEVLLTRISILGEIATMVEYDKFFTQAKIDSAVTYSKVRLDMALKNMKIKLLIKLLIEED